MEQNKTMTLDWLGMARQQKFTELTKGKRSMYISYLYLDTQSMCSKVTRSNCQQALAVL